jgi:hypothetical protein
MKGPSVNSGYSLQGFYLGWGGVVVVLGVVLGTCPGGHGFAAVPEDVLPVLAAVVLPGWVVLPDIVLVPGVVPVVPGVVLAAGDVELPGIICPVADGFEVVVPGLTVQGVVPVAEPGAATPDVPVSGVAVLEGVVLGVVVVVLVVELVLLVLGGIVLGFVLGVAVCGAGVAVWVPGLAV